MSVKFRYVVSVFAHNGDYVNFECDVNNETRVIISIDGMSWSVNKDDLIRAVETVASRCDEK